MIIENEIPKKWDRLKEFRAKIDSIGSFRKSAREIEAMNGLPLLFPSGKSVKATVTASYLSRVYNGLFPTKWRSELESWINSPSTKKDYPKGK